MKRGNLLRKVSALFSLIIALSAANCFADATVYVSFTGFSPSSASIGVGETVWFIVADDMGPYMIQSTTGAWSPFYLFDEGEGMGLTFNQAGDYSYRDGFSWNSGIIHVGNSVPNILPTLDITSPAEAAVFTEPATVTISADASDADTGMWFVEFYLGSDWLDTLYNPPYTTTISDLAAGSYTVSVNAYDMAVGMTTKSVTFTVQPAAAPTIMLSAPVLEAGQFQFTATGLTPGKQVVLQSSTSVSGSGSWVNVETKVADAATMPFTTPAVSGAQFFRVEQLP